MNANVGKADRIFRFVVGVVIVAAGIYSQSWWGAVGIIPLFTAAIRWCPLYAPFKISTAKSES